MCAKVIRAEGLSIVGVHFGEIGQKWNEDRINLKRMEYDPLSKGNDI